MRQKVCVYPYQEMKIFDLLTPVSFTKELADVINRGFVSEFSSLSFVATQSVNRMKTHSRSRSANPA